ncbi:hypothetical protein QR98_0093950 [Sarcoptes scabiei]|uniref:Uncharacterized protein n=1 Tax=Sarcoptes scabiei TaxID=52283 RepID=A0A132AIL9_SARSC|nr:hypothetical protein QR98_0093950 [Sarcoptes scabiei]
MSQKARELHLLHSGYRNPTYFECLLPGYGTLVSFFFLDLGYRNTVSCVCCTKATDIPDIANAYSQATELVQTASLNTQVTEILYSANAYPQAFILQLIANPHIAYC